MKREDQLLKIVGFGANWAAALWHVMARTGNGYRRQSLKHTGIGDDRRKDKLSGVPKRFRQYRQRYS
jgi:hypothetical protein